MRVLVTGGCGFIGTPLVRALLRQGHTVVALDDNTRGDMGRLRGLGGRLTLSVGSVCDYDRVLHATRDCDVVWHLAYINGTRYFYERPDDVLEVGVKGALHTVEAALAQGVRRYVLASSSETYCEPEVVPTPETETLKIPDVTNPRFSYGGGKIASELLALHLGGRRGLETVIVRPHNFYGPDMGFEHVIPEITRRIVEDTDLLTRRHIDLPIQGTGTETRAFCFVSDGVRGALIAADRGAPGGIYHLGAEHEIQIGTLVTMIAEILGVTVQIVPGAIREGGTTRRCPDISRLRALGYEPDVSLEQGLRTTVEWYARHYLASGRGSGESTWCPQAAPVGHTP